MPIDLSTPQRQERNEIGEVIYVPIQLDNDQLKTKTGIIDGIVKIAFSLGFVNNNASVEYNHEATHEAAVGMIHRYAVLHAAVALLLGPLAGFALTIATVKMVCDLGNLCGIAISKQGLTNFVAHYLGLIAGVVIANVISGLIPGIGNLSNAVSSFFVTQALGRATLSLFEQQNGFNLEDIGSEFKQKFQEELIKALHNTGTYNSMSESDKKDFDEFVAKIFSRENFDQNKSSEVEAEGKEILGKYKETLEKEARGYEKQFDSEKENANSLNNLIKRIPLDLLRSLFGVLFKKS